MNRSEARAHAEQGNQSHISGHQLGQQRARVHAQVQEHALPDKRPGHRAQRQSMHRLPEQAGHVCESSEADQVSPIVLLRDQARVHQLPEVKRQRSGGDIQLLTQGAGRGASWTRNDPWTRHAIRRTPPS